ncbi:hypothetical protein EWF20_00740 [Sulfolobus sp. S-194]|uniref:RAMP superfamily CRISPR-associated protein n=1 Tax=Sulfolobus sp. S-194 TaxID=2512240 RepID=UPI001436D09F|nr:RAMP superfamily CRISPR-associated protein [Sulfolobus sp. S-194]QIW22832.1 hypothetical protein EWF20_00740 [Sulfolobus sp. S-194]
MSSERKIYLFKLKFNTPYGLRVGGNSQDINALIPLSIGEHYLIPSSTWKGIFRRATEVLLAKPSHFNEHKNEEVQYDSSMDELLKSKGIEKEEEKKKFIAMWNCPIERLYGSEYFASAVTFSDTLIKAGITERFHATIDRKTKKGMERYLFREQIVDVKSVNAKIIVRDRIEEWVKTLKFLSDVGTFIGGGKSRGIGYAMLDWKESEYAEVDKLTRKITFRPLEELKI